MRTTNTLGIQFIIRKNKVKDNGNQAPIYARITVVPASVVNKLALVKNRGLIITF